VFGFLLSKEHFIWTKEIKYINTEVMFSSKTDQWETPQDFFDKLDEEFHFTLDPCANEFNYKCDTYFTEEKDGLKQNWEGYTVFYNPPYGSVIKDWVSKCSIDLF
jgi:site-specific DNA-methyltransferase (adenine-specific)